MTRQPAPLHVLVVDDHKPTLISAELVLRTRHSDVRTATTLAAARSAIASLAPLDVCVLDLSLPDGDGLSLLPLLKRRKPPVAVVVMSVLDNPERVLAALAAGAEGYLIKEDLGLGLLEAVEQAARGAMPVSPQVANVIRQGLQQRGQPLAECPLTSAELSVLAGFARGLSYDTVGQELGISINTVRTYVRSVYAKLGVETKTAAVLLGLRAGWLAPEQIAK
jgi:DNA-binding NarL/FixJ family response regulator